MQATRERANSHPGVQKDVGVAGVELALVRLVVGALLDHLELLDAPNLQAGALAGALEGVIEDGRHTLGCLVRGCGAGTRMRRRMEGGKNVNGGNGNRTGKGRRGRGELGRGV